MNGYWSYVIFYGSALLAGLVLAGLTILLVRIHPAVAIIVLAALIVFGAPALGTLAGE